MNLSLVARYRSARVTGQPRPGPKSAAINLAVDWPSAVEAWPERLPDLYLGQPLLVAANFGDAYPQGEIVVRGEIDGQQWRQRLQLPSGVDPQSVSGHPGVASVWARQKITGLMDQQVAGRSEIEVRDSVLAVALAHQVVSPYTSFVAVEEVISRPAGEQLDQTSVANTRPRGQSPQQFAYPRGATWGPVQLWLGSLLLFLALLLRVMRRGDADLVPARRA